jgi:hypothetical protein
MNLRKINAALHRDIGYLAVALTLVYAISGIAINHIADWNPNYRKIEQVLHIQPLDINLSQEELTESACSQLGLPKPRSSFQPDENTLQLLYGGADARTYGIDLPTGAVIMQETKPRPVLYALNRLHQNAQKKLWTYIADLYAVSLAFLAISGLFILKGRMGITGRGAWMASIGALIPIAYWIWHINQ